MFRELTFRLGFLMQARVLYRRPWGRGGVGSVGIAADCDRCDPLSS